MDNHRLQQTIERQRVWNSSASADCLVGFHLHARCSSLLSYQSLNVDPSSSVVSTRVVALHSENFDHPPSTQGHTTPEAESCVKVALEARMATQPVRHNISIQFTRAILSWFIVRRFRPKQVWTMPISSTEHSEQPEHRCMLEPCSMYTGALSSRVEPVEALNYIWLKYDIVSRCQKFARNFTRTSILKNEWSWP